MRLSWRAREYQRTCADCRYVWRVPRTAMHKPVSGYSVAPRGRAVNLGGIDPVTPASAPEIASSEAISETMAAYGHCPKCGSERYTQRKIRS